MSLLVLGSRKSGQTTIVNFIAGKKAGSGAPLPTETINWQSFQIGNQHFRSIQIGGVADTGQRWQDIIKRPQGIILVAEGPGRANIKQAQRFFDQVLSQEKLREVPVLIFANKADIKVYNDELIEDLKIMEVSDREVFVQASCALNGEGILEGVEKLIENLRPSSSDQRGNGYSFEAQPKIVKGKQKYKNQQDMEEFAKKSMQTFARLMQDKEVKKQHPTHQQAEYIRMEKDRIKLENMHSQLQNFKTNQQKMTPYDIKPSPNPKIDVNLEFFLTDNKNTIAPQENNCDAQTDEFLRPPPSPKYIPKKTGIDKYTQVEDNELFDFDREVTPIVDVIVTQTLEESLLEIEQQQELENMKEFKNQFNQRRNQDKQHQKQVLDEQFQVMQIKQDLKSQFEKRESRIQETLRVTQAYGIAKQFLRFVQPNSFNYLYENGLYQNQPKNQISIQFMDWLVEQTVKEIEIKKTVDSNLDGMYDCVSIPVLETQAQPIFEIRAQKRARHQLRRTNWTNDKRFVRFYYQNEIVVNPSLFFQHFNQFIDNSFQDFEKSYRAKVDEIQAKIDAVEVQPEEQFQLLETDFPQITANYTGFNIQKVRRIAFTLAHDCFYITDQQDRNLQLECVALDKEGVVIGRVNKDSSLLAPDSKAIKYKRKIRDKELKVTEDECILITHQSLPEQIETLLLFARVRNLQTYAATLEKRPDLNKNARYGLVDFEHGIELEHTNLIPTHKLDDLAKPQDPDAAPQEQNSFILSYTLFRTPGGGWRFETIKVPSQGLFDSEHQDFFTKIGTFMHHVNQQSVLALEKLDPLNSLPEEVRSDPAHYCHLPSQVYNVFELNLQGDLEETQKLLRVKLESQDPPLVGTCPDGYELKLRGQQITRVSKFTKTRNAFQLTIYRIPPPPPVKQEDEEPQQQGDVEANDENPENQDP